MSTSIEDEICPGAKRSACWRMRRDSFIESELARVRSARVSGGLSRDLRDEEAEYRTVIAQEHEKETQWALNDGLPVPAEVLADYPDMEAVENMTGESRYIAPLFSAPKGETT